jgi:hypothetical protein
MHNFHRENDTMTALAWIIVTLCAAGIIRQLIVTYRAHRRGTWS